MGSLHLLPPEIRTQVFYQEALLKKRRWTNSSPPLLAALRSDPTLYREALEVFNDVNTFILDHSNNWSFDRVLSASAIQAVRSVHIRFWLQDGHDSQLIVPSKEFLCKTTSGGAERVRTLKLEFNFKVQGREAEVVPLIRWGIGAFVLETFQICICHTTLQDGAQALINQINTALGVLADTSEVETNGYIFRSWRAQKGKTLHWDTVEECVASLAPETPALLGQLSDEMLEAAT